MIRLLPILLIILATATFIIFRLSGINLPTFTLPGKFSISQNLPAGRQVATPSASLDSRVSELEFAVTDLLSKTGSNTSLSQTSSLDSQIKSLESSIDDLKSRVSKLESSPAPAATTTSSTVSSSTSTGAKVAYIPIGYTGSVTAGDWTNVTSHEVTIDTDNYPGYKSMTLEANFRIFQGNGTGFVRLLNKTAGTAILSSELSSSSETYATKTSSSFSISSGSKIYVIQAKSTTGYAVDLQWSRLRVDF